MCFEKNPKTLSFVQDLCARMYAGYKDSSDTLHENSQNSWHFQISEKERRYDHTHWSTMTLKLFNKIFWER